jgi:hypothetical protein
MRHLGKLIALTAVALAFAGTTAAQADPGIQNHMKVDGTITVSDITCTWVDGMTSDNPPNMLFIYASSLSMVCTGATVTLNNDPKVTFDDANGKAIVDLVNVTGNRIGVECTYAATNIMLTRDGTTRRYTGTFTATRTAGSIFFCPSSHSGSADITFK